MKVPNHIKETFHLYSYYYYKAFRTKLTKGEKIKMGKAERKVINFYAEETTTQTIINGELDSRKMTKQLIRNAILRRKWLAL